MELLLISAAIASISVTITKSSLFKPIRKLGKLLRCSYCLSHYLAFVGIIIIGFNGPIDFIIKSFAVVTFSSLFTLPLVILLEKLDRE